MEYVGSKAFENEVYKNCLLQMVNGNIFSTCKSEEDIRKKFEAETNRILQLRFKAMGRRKIQVGGRKVVSGQLG